MNMATETNATCGAAPSIESASLTGSDTVVIGPDAPIGPDRSGRDATADAADPTASSQSATEGDGEQAGLWTRRFLEDGDTRRVSERLVPRAVRLLRRIADEGERRGYAVVRPDDIELAVDHESDMAWAHIILRKDETAYFMQIHEIAKAGMPVREPFSGGRGNAPLPMWLDERNREFVGTGMLMLEVRSENAHCHQRTCRDSGRSLIEDRLERVFDSMDLVQDRVDRDRRCKAECERRKRERYAEYRSMKLLESLQRRADEYSVWLRRKEYLDALERTAARQEGMLNEPLLDDIAALRRQLEKSDPLDDPDRLGFDIPMPSDYEIEIYLRQRDAAHPMASAYDRWHGDDAYGCRRQRMGAGDGFGGYCYANEGTYDDDSF